MPVHGEVHTISSGFSGGGPIASQRKKYSRSVMSVEAFEDHSPDVDIMFTKEDLRDIVPHDNDPIMVSLVMAGRMVYRVLVDQGSSTDVMFWPTFEKLQLSPDQLRPYGGCLYGFAGDQVEVRGYIELRTMFMDGSASRTEKIRYLVVNAPSAYNILLGRPTLNRIGGVPSTRHMKVKLPSMEGVVITIRSDQKRQRSVMRTTLILPVGLSARALPRQRFLLLDQLRTTLASVLQASIPRKNLKETEWRRCGRSRSDAQVSDGITKY